MSEIKIDDTIRYRGHGVVTHVIGGTEIRWVDKEGNKNWTDVVDLVRIPTIEEVTDIINANLTVRGIVISMKQSREMAIIVHALYGFTEEQ